MFELPSVWNIVISTIVFMVAAWLIRRWLEENGVAKSMTRGFIVFVLAYAVSWASGEAVDWVHDKIYGKGLILGWSTSTAQGHELIVGTRSSTSWSALSKINSTTVVCIG
jgi:hypothetical protein